MRTPKAMVRSWISTSLTIGSVTSPKVTTSLISSLTNSPGFGFAASTRMIVFPIAIAIVKNKTDTYRILYDSKIDKYIIANSYDYTHFEMLKKAYDEGYYIDVEDYIDNVSDGLHSYFHDGVYGDSSDPDRTIVCYIVYPDSGSKWLYDDNYDAGYLLDTDKFRFPNEARVVVGIKGNAFTDSQFFKAFGKPRILSKKELKL